MKRGRENSGFTLVELLIAMAISGVIIMAVLSWQLSSTDASIRSNALVQSLSELNDLTGYVGDRVRSAHAIRLDGFTVNSATASNAGKCDSTTPCLGILVLDEKYDSSTGNTEKVWKRIIYRMEKRSDWSSTDANKTKNDWADKDENKIMILREYRSTCKVGEAGCDPIAFKDGFSTLPAFSNMQPSLVADFLTSTDQAGTAIVPFAKTGSAVELKFQYKQPVQGKATYLPRTGPYTLTVQARNAN